MRLADSVPALVFGLHGGLVADRSDRRRVMVFADVARGAVLVPIAVAGLAGDLQLWMLVVAAFLPETVTSYFEPAYGALLPTLVDRSNVQAANGLVRASAEALRVVGLISLVHRGSHATGLILIAPLFAVFATRTVFWGAAVTLPLVGLLSLAAVGAARARAQD